jgi:glycosyltransferase involved in cell wall biosynthesis
MDSQPLVSVLMTAYNREKYIAEAIESVLASTYKNFELIIVDDCSKDGTVAIAKTYQQQNSRVKIYQNQQNLGDYPNRNQAAKYATGKYLKYVDADDLIYPWGLEILVKCMEQFPEAGWGLCSLEQLIDKQFPIELKVNEIYRYNFFIKSIFHKAPLSSIITKKAFDDIGGFTGKQHLGDFELWHILGLNSPVVLMCQGVVWFRHHNDQQSLENRENPQVNLKYLVSQYNFLKTQSQEIPLKVEELKIICKGLKISLLKQLTKFLIVFDFKNFFNLLKMINNKVAYNFTLPSNRKY